MIEEVESAAAPFGKVRTRESCKFEKGKCSERYLDESKQKKQNENEEHAQIMSLHGIPKITRKV